MSKHNNKAIWQVEQLLKKYNSGSYKTQSNRAQTLRQAMQELVKDGGYKIEDVHNLKPKHIVYLAKIWKERGLTEGTLKTKMADLRWLAEAIGKPNIIPRSNAELGIGQRVYLTNQQKAATLTREKLEIIGDRNIIVSLMLQAAFGLRREEALKIMPALADCGNVLWLKGSWCKGGRERTIPIETTEQRAILNLAKEVAGNGSLIPPDKSYKEHAKLYDELTAKAGIKGHGLRHSYAQGLYKKIAGFDCKVAGGKSRQEMTLEEKKLDIQARQIITQQLGHSRIEITNSYLGR